MSASELCWRLRGAVRDSVDRVRFRSVAQSELADGLLTRRDGALGGGFDVMPAGLSGILRSNPIDTSLINRANDAVAGRIDLFDLPRKFIGDPPDWNRDHKHNIAPPPSLSQTIDYRSFATVGDCKFVWEPNRHQHFVILARAFQRTGDQRYATTIARQIASWLDQCPFAHGMNWRSPLELGIRLINWVWALSMIRDSGAIDARLAARIRESVALHVWEIARKYSRGSSANNHLIGEAAGVSIATAYFPELRGAARMRREAREILSLEIMRQTHVDGGSAEQAFGYHVFITQFFTLAAIVARVIGEDFDPALWKRLEAMYAFAAEMLAGGDAPNFGDADDGYVIDLGADPRDFREWLPVGAALFNRAEFVRQGSDAIGPAQWLLNAASLTNGDESSAFASAAFRETGIYLLQSGSRTEQNALSVLFDCGPLGYGPLAAHGHADALSFTLRVNGREVFADAGTYDYFTYPEWRDYFRGTPAHNTITIFGRNQSELLGPFQWGHRAESRCLEWSPAESGGRVAGEHDGYARMGLGVIHRRSITLDSVGGVIRVEDCLVGRAGLPFEVRFHVGMGCRVAEIHGNQVEIETSDGDRAFLSLPRELKTRVIAGDNHQSGGWVSRGYHRRTAVATIAAAGVTSGDNRLCTEILVSFRRHASAQRMAQRPGLIGSGAIE
ncbi:MAG: alginate lyase family protein [Phycisphaerales bacterium]|nr:alginate lyase family protein [Phycisphaerales bacterium]